jgi:hypothetical protein
MTDRSNAALVVKLIGLTRAGKLFWIAESEDAFVATVSGENVRVFREPLRPSDILMGSASLGAKFSLSFIDDRGLPKWSIFDVPALRDLFTAASESPPPEIQEKIAQIMRL